MKDIIPSAIFALLVVLSGSHGQMLQSITNARAAVAAGPNCSLCVLVQATNSGNSSAHSDGTTLNGVVAGHALVVYFTHSNWSAGGTVSISGGSDTWYPCSGTTAGASFTDIQVDAGNGESCFYSVNVAAGNTTMLAIASQCVSTLCSLGGSYMEYSGVATTVAQAYGGWGHTDNGTAGSGTNNSTCGTTVAAIATQANALVICGVDMATGSSTAGTSPITFSQDQVGTWVAVEHAVWTSSGSMNAKYTDSVTGDKHAGIELLLN